MCHIAHLPGVATTPAIMLRGTTCRQMLPCSDDWGSFFLDVAYGLNYSRKLSNRGVEMYLSALRVRSQRSA